MKLNELLFFFIMIIGGFFAARSKLIPRESEKAFPQLLMNICYPAMILKTLSDIPLEEMLRTGLFAVLSTLVVTVLLYILSGIIFRRQPLRRQAQLRLQTGVGNVVYITIPLLGALFGPEVMFIAIMHSVTQDVLIWTLYYPLTLSLASKSGESTWIRLAKSPCILALIAALILMVSGLQMPEFISYTVGRLSDMVAPTALIYLGLLLDKYGLFEWTRDRLAIAYALLKTSLIPLLVIAILYPLTDRMTALVIGLLFGSSAPVISVVWADGYDGDIPAAINCFISSTIIHIVMILTAGFILLKCGILA